MIDALLVAAGFILLTVAARARPGVEGTRRLDRMMAVQLLGTAASRFVPPDRVGDDGRRRRGRRARPALLAAFASVAFVNSAGSAGPEPLEGEDG
jgi:hypothetical protein